MVAGPGGRRKVDLTGLPGWAQLVCALGTVLVVAAVALLVGRPDGGPVVPVTAVGAAIIAFAVVAWHAQHRR